MKRTIWGSVILALILTAGLVGLGLVVFNAGVAQGVAESGNWVAPAAGSAVPGPYAWHGYPHIWGFGPLGCLIPLLLVLVLFGFLRRLFWFRPWGPGGVYPGWGHHRRGHTGWEKDYPPFFDAWHRRAHGETKEDGPNDPNSD